MEDIADLMTPNPVVVTEGTPLAHAAHMLLTLGIRHLPVVDGDGRLAGVVTDHAAFRDRPGDRVAGDVAVPVSIVVGPDAGLSKVFAKMLAVRQELAVVVNDERHPIGIVTEHDGVRLAQGLLAPELTSIRSASWPVFAVERDQPAEVAAAVMRRNHVRHVVVTDNGLLFGVLAFRDLAIADVASRLAMRADEVIRHGRLIKAIGDRPLLWMARQMTANRIGCVPIVDAEGYAHAIITRTDVLHALVSALENEALFPELAHAG